MHFYTVMLRRALLLGYVPACLNTGTVEAVWLLPGGIGYICSGRGCVSLWLEDVADWRWIRGSAVAGRLWIPCRAVIWGSAGVFSLLDAVTATLSSGVLQLLCFTTQCTNLCLFFFLVCMLMH